MAANLLDRAISYLSPAAGAKRAHARAIMAHYEANKPRKDGKMPRRVAERSPNDITQQGAAQLRATARDLERNHDLFRGAIRVLVNNVVGSTGIGVEPQPRRRDGTIHTEYAAALADAWQHYREHPEVTGRFSDSQLQRMACRTWLRDGEVFAQQLFGAVPGLHHGGDVPYSLEVFEPDFVPLDYTDYERKIHQGIRVNAWGRPTHYHVFKHDPRDWQGGGSIATWGNPASMKAIPAERMMHLAFIDRLHQLRGVSSAAAVINRIDALKDYEEYEQVAAEIAASLTGYVKRASPDGFNPADVPTDENGNPLPRDLYLQPGLIIDDLLIGEEIGTIKSDRPNPNLVGWRAGQLRAVAAGWGVSNSSLSKDYTTGSYSSQRQELVESWIDYAVLADEFACGWVKPHYERFVEIAHLSGVVPRPADVLPKSADDAMFVAQQMPWIDPLKEAKAWELRTRAGFASEMQAIRAAGGNPRDVLQQAAEWRTKAADAGLVFTSDAANDASKLRAESGSGIGQDVELDEDERKE